MTARSAVRMSARAERDAPAGPSRERILEAAFHLFSEHGFSRVTMRTVAEQVGLHNSSLFHHFRSKSEIARHVFDAVLERLLPLIEPLDGDDPASLDFFVERCLAVADHFLDQPDDARFVMRVILDPEVFLADYVDRLDTDDAAQPVVRLFSSLWTWLGRARESGAIRPVRVYQVTRNLMGVLVFEPAYSLGERQSDSDLSRMTATEFAERRRQRLLELEAFVRGALAPDPRTDR